MNQINPEIIDGFMYRFPKLNFNSIKRIYNYEEQNLSKREIILQLWNIEELRMAIGIASPSLYTALENVDNKNGKELDQLYTSILKYYIRMFSRPTPFGTFSSVGMGTFQDNGENSLRLDPNKNKVKIRLSHEWLYKFIALIEKDQSVFKQLHLRMNKLIRTKGNKFSISYYSQGGTEEETIIEEVSLVQSNVLAVILQAFAETSKVKEVVTQIVTHNKNVDEATVIGYLQGLVEKDFLISELKLSASIENPVDYLLTTLKDMGVVAEKYYTQLHHLKELTKLDNPNRNDIKKVEEHMKNIVKTTDYLHIDMYYSNQKLHLSKKVQKDIENYAKVMMKVSQITFSEKNYMDYYLNKFIDRYGTKNAISVRDLIEDSTELGPPPTYANPAGLLDYDYSNDSDENETSNTFLRDLLWKALYENQESIDVKELLETTEPYASIPTEGGSFDIYLSIYADSYNNLMNGNYKLYPTGNIVSPFAGRTMGRFLDMFPDIMESFQITVNEKEEQISGRLLANVNILPKNGKASNVMNVANKFPYEITISSDHNPSKIPVDLDDLYIFTDGHKFHIFSKKFNKLIAPINSHMLNHQFSKPNIYRFLIDASAYKRTQLIPFNWGKYEDLPFTPEVTYGKYVLKQKSWNISIGDTKDLKEIKKIVTSFFEKYNVPRYIRHIDFDNYIFIDTQSKIMMNLFYNELKKKNSIKIVEASEFNHSSILIDDNQQPYINELVVSAFQTTNQKIETDDINNSITFYQKDDRIKHFGSDWIYLKLYHPVNYENNILTSHVNQFFQENFYHNPSYFIRYNDPYPHIRLRVKKEPTDFTIIEKLNAFISNLYDQKLITRWSFDMYDREVERYGGRSLIEAAEEIFCLDSLLVIKLLALIQNKDSKQTLEDFALASTIDFLQLFVEENNEYEWLTENMDENKKYYKDFRTNIKNRRSEFDHARTLYQQTCQDEFAMLSTRISNYKELGNNEKLSPVYFNQIIASMIHMHLNRLGIHSESEDRLMNYLFFYCKEEFIKNKNKKKLVDIN